MKIQKGTSVLLTGASGGIGEVIARELASRGASLAITGYPVEGLEKLAQDLRRSATRVVFAEADLRADDERKRLVEWAEAELGQVDILINNAGVEFTAPLHALSDEQVRTLLCVNLEAAVSLTRCTLRGMLTRKSGHVVNIASLAGLSPPAYQELYAATKAGLVAFTWSMRASYRGTGVSASAICPSFVAAGMHTRYRKRTGVALPKVLGTVSPERVAAAVVQAIQRNKAEVIVSDQPVRWLLALQALLPSAAERLNEFFGSHDFFRRGYESDIATASGVLAPQAAPLE